jgi:hypothetical protein
MGFNSQQAQEIFSTPQHPDWHAVCRELDVLQEYIAFIRVEEAIKSI